MKTAIVILNWNTKDFLGRFLPALTESVKGVTGAEVIVADNASDDGSVEFLRNTFPDIRTVVFEKNLGFTGGYNRAFEEIVTKGGDDAPEYFLLLNSDIEVAEGWLEPLVDWMDNHPECGACAPKLHSWHRKEYFEYAGAAGGHIDIFGYPFCRGRIMSKVECDSGQYDNMHPDVFWVSGACLMVRSRTFSELGGLDERFFAHMEEIDLCWRIQLAGQKVCVVNGSKVYHVGGGTLPAVSPFKLFLNYRNNLLMLDNNLAYTYAIRHYRHGLSKVSAAEAGIRDAERTIRTRMLLDGLSATVYLLTFRFKYFKSVVKAHREYRKMKKPCDAGMLASFLRTRKDTEIRNIFGKWMVLQYLIHGRRTFAGIHETDFIKF
jgi:GT2 family glycosyltransferase